MRRLRRELAGLYGVPSYAHYVTKRGGGDAGVREAIEEILKAQGTWSAVSKKARA